VQPKPAAPAFAGKARKKFLYVKSSQQLNLAKGSQRNAYA
jgi:hypothetical protein